MTKAEEKALKAIPHHPNDGLENQRKRFRKFYQEGYEQAEKDINKELMDKMAEIREKQNEDALLDYDIHIDTSNCSDTSLGYFFKGDKIVNELTIKDLELLHTFLYAVKNNKQGVFTFTRLSDEQYNEVLRRFKEAKNANI